MKNLPTELIIKLLEIRDCLIKGDNQEAYHVLYSIADPEFEKYLPWEDWENQVKNSNL